MGAISTVTLLITLLITTHEPPSNLQSVVLQGPNLGFGAFRVQGLGLRIQKRVQ